MRAPHVWGGAVALAVALVPAVGLFAGPEGACPFVSEDGESEDAPAGAEHAACRAREARLRAEFETQIAELRFEARRERDLRIEREREWLRYTQGMAQLQVLAGLPRFEPDVPAEERETRALGGAAAETATAEPVAAAPAPVETAPTVPDRLRLAREERARAVYLALRSLFAIEHVSGLDLLESGVVTDGATGPVVLRVIDESGRPLGSLYADRLRLEGSHAARTLALVLENGWERRVGRKTPFEGGPPDAEGRAGVRRIELAHVDPAPWFEALPELFREEQRVAATEGDVRGLTALRFELNRRLQADASGVVYRLESLMARDGLVLREVHLAVLDGDMRLERELFADHMSVQRAERGLEILLQNGSQIRGSEKAPFLEGRYRIFLPRASADAWTAAGIPVGVRGATAAPGPAGG